MTIVIFKRLKNPENPEKIRENPEFYYLKMIQNTQDTYLNRKKIQDTNYLEISRKVILKKKVNTRAPLASLRELKRRKKNEKEKSQKKGTR